MSLTGSFTIQLLHDGIPPHKLTFSGQSESLTAEYENEHGIQAVQDLSTAQSGKEIKFSCMNGMNNDEEFLFTLHYDGSGLIGGALNLTDPSKGICPAKGFR